MPWRARDLAPAVLALGLLVGGGAALASLPESPPVGLGLLGSALALGLMLLGRRAHPAGAYAVFALRLALAAALLTGSVLLLRSGLYAQALGVAWAIGGVGLALGFLAPWAGLYAALALPLVVPLGGHPAWLGLALAALALALTDDDTLSLDARLRARGGLFPTLRTEVVLEERRGR